MSSSRLSRIVSLCGFQHWQRVKVEGPVNCWKYPIKGEKVKSKYGLQPEYILVRLLDFLYLKV